jgi:hypothetical protein
MLATCFRRIQLSWSKEPNYCRSTVKVLDFELDCVDHCINLYLPNASFDSLYVFSHYQRVKIEYVQEETSVSHIPTGP